jgi:8-oxo-dGTP pyrophosphatase MutT (NUDIX family)
MMNMEGNNDDLGLLKTRLSFLTFPIKPLTPPPSPMQSPMQSPIMTRHRGQFSPSSSPTSPTMSPRVRRPSKPRDDQIHTLPLEKSVGAILVSPEGKVLIVKGVNAKWGFPKGHTEDDEKELQTMLREVREEVSINVAGAVLGRIEESFIMFHSQARINMYVNAGKDPWRWTPCYVNRTNVYFVVRHPQTEVTLQQDEILEATWVDIPRAKEIFIENKSKFVGVLDKVATMINSEKNLALDLAERLSNLSIPSSES